MVGILFVITNPKNLRLHFISLSPDFYYNSLPEAFGCRFHRKKGLSQNSEFGVAPKKRPHFIFTLHIRITRAIRYEADNTIYTKNLDRE